MPAKKYLKEYFVVSVWTTYGMRLYLSNVGFITSGVHHGVWEPGFENARQFLTKTDAVENGRIALSDIPGKAELMVHRHRVTKEGKTEIDFVKEPTPQTEE